MGSEPSFTMAITIHALAGAYRANGQIKNAVELLEHVVKVKEANLADNHPSRLASQHDLAIAYQADGQIKDTVELLEQVVKVHKANLAENHPDHLVSQRALAHIRQTEERNMS
ncbi:hypothetical protein LTR08_003942 [Meristemomyces frigidus]|nr:hypothetical protein LTR08_003942 [Meristemomyces frigidus]